MSLAAVTLDAVGTLFTPREAVGVTYARVAATHGIALDAAATGARFRDALRAAPPLAFPAIPPDQRGSAARAWWRDVVREAFGAGGRHPRFEASFDALWAQYAGPDAWLVAEDAHDTLRALRARGLALGIVSNFDGRLGGVLAGLGLTPLVDAVVPSGTHDFAKPDPRLFRAAADLLGATPRELLHVGDDVELDVRGALAAGCRALLLAREGGAAPPGVPVLRRLRDLPDAIWEAGPPSVRGRRAPRPAE